MYINTSNETAGISYNVMLFIHHPLLYVFWIQNGRRGSYWCFFYPGILGQGSSYIIMFSSFFDQYVHCAPMNINIYIGTYIIVYAFAIIDYSNNISTLSEGVSFAFNPYLCACVTCIFSCYSSLYYYMTHIYCIYLYIRIVGTQ